MASPGQEAMRHRLEALIRFDAWVAAHPICLSAADAVAAAGRLYDLLPPASRHRTVDPHGVMTLHRLLQRAVVAR